MIESNLNLSLGSRLSAGLAWALFACLSASPIWPDTLYVAALAGAALTWLNADLYRFFRQKRGWRFALRAIPWHWLYYLYGSAAFAYVLLAERHRTPPTPRLVVSADTIKTQQHGQ